MEKRIFTHWIKAPSITASDIHPVPAKQTTKHYSTSVQSLFKISARVSHAPVK
jgi:hypothetical protein